LRRARARIIELCHEHLMTSFLGSLFGLLVQSLALWFLG
jgi:hypothetical protein